MTVHASGAEVTSEVSGLGVVRSPGAGETATGSGITVSVDVAAVAGRLASLAEVSPRPPSTFVARGETISAATVYRAVLPQDFSEQIAQDLADFVGRLGDRDLLPYDPSYQTSSSQAFVDRVSEVEALARLDAEVRGGDVDVDDADVSAPVALCHAAGFGETTVVGYRILRASTLLKRTIFALEGGRYRPVEHPLVYEPGFDAITVDGVVVFTNVTFVASRMESDERARRHTRATLTNVVRDLRISGVEDMVETAAATPAMRGKVEALGRLLERDREYASHLTMENLVAFVREHDIEIEIGQVEGRDVLVYDPAPQHRFAILNLLSDDHLHSALTDRDYEAGSKRRL